MVSNMIVNMPTLSKPARETIIAGIAIVGLVVASAALTLSLANRMVDKSNKTAQYYDMGNAVQVIIDKDAEVVCYRVGLSTLYCGKFDAKPVL